jgi:hypothetical protein
LPRCVQDGREPGTRISIAERLIEKLPLSRPNFDKIRRISLLKDLFSETAEITCQVPPPIVLSCPA